MKRFEIKFQKIIKEFMLMILEEDDINKVVQVGIRKDELSKIMKITAFRIKDIKNDLVNWVEEPPLDKYRIKLSFKPSPFEIYTKALDYISMCKEYTFLQDFKRILDMISEKFNVTMFHSMSDAENEEYMRENFKDYGEKKKLNSFFQ